MAGAREKPGGTDGEDGTITSVSLVQRDLDNAGRDLRTVLRVKPGSR